MIRNIPVSGNIVNVSTSANEKEVLALCAIWDLYTNDKDPTNKAKAEFMIRWDRYPALNKLHQWWNSLSDAFTITQVGTVLAHTNARRCDNSIPELPLAT